MTVTNTGQVAQTASAQASLKSPSPPLNSPVVHDSTSYNYHESKKRSTGSDEVITVAVLEGFPGSTLSTVE
eukprot:UC1_evm1s1787